MKKLHDIDKLARDGTRQPPPFAYDGSRWDAIEAHLEQNTGKRKTPAAWWIWAASGALVLSGGLMLWFSSQEAESMKPLHAKRAVERVTGNSLQSMSGYKTGTESESATFGMAAEAGQGQTESGMSEITLPATLGASDPSGTMRESSSHQSMAPQESPVQEIVVNERQPDDAGHPPEHIGQVPTSDNDDFVADETAGQQERTGNDGNASGYDSTDHATFGPWQISPGSEDPATASGETRETTGPASPNRAVGAESRMPVTLDALQRYNYEHTLLLPAIPERDFHEELARFTGGIPKWHVYLDLGNRVLPSWASGNMLLLNPHAGAGIGYRPVVHWQFTAGLRAYLRQGEDLVCSVDVIGYSFGRYTERHTQHLERLWYLEMPLGISYLAGSRTWVGLGLNPAWLMTTQSQIVISLPDLPGEAPVKSEVGWHYLDGLSRFDVAADARFGYRITELTDLYIRGHIGLLTVPEAGYFDTGSGRSHGIVFGIKHHLK